MNRITQTTTRVRPSMHARGAALALLAATMIGSPVLGQVVPAPRHTEPYQLRSGMHRGTGEETTLAFQAVIQIPGVPWMRLHFSDYNLGQSSYLTITSLRDGGWQYLDATSLAQWQSSSAFFNGDSLEIALYVAPADEDVSISIDQITVGEWVGDSWGGVPRSLCGSDNRVPSSDPAVGRLFIGGCTAYLASNGAVLTAGHCVDWDTDQCGPLLPDGILDLWGVVEFNIPASQADGTTVAADPDDQYPIDTGSVVWNFDGECQGLGKDWAVFACFPNSNTGELPQFAQGAFFRLTDRKPATDQSVRVTGCGVDDTPDSRNCTQQTSTGPYKGESHSGADYWHKYQVDTRGANSGSPVIWEAQGLVIGVHTNAGCAADGTGYNRGTSFEHNPLEDALQDFPGPNTFYVDANPPSSNSLGLIFDPFHSVQAAISSVPAGSTVSIVAGTYDEVMTIDRAMTLTAPVGSVTIGN